MFFPFQDMKIKPAITALLTLFISFHVLSADELNPEAVGGRINLTGIDTARHIYSLRGEWQFYWNQLLEKIPAAAGDNIQVPRNWAASKQYSAAGYGSYTLELQGLTPGNLYQLYVPEVLSAYKLFLNGKLVSTNGTVGTERKSSHPAFLPKTVLFEAAEKEELVLQVSDFHYRKSGIWRDFHIARPALISAYYQKKLIIEAFLVGLLIFVSVYHLSVFFFRKEEKAAFYFGLICLVLVLRLLTTGEQLLTYYIPNFPWEIARRFEFLPFSAVAGLSALYFYTLYPSEFSRTFLKYYEIGIIFFAVVFILLPIRISNHFITAGELYFFAGLLYSIYVIFKALRASRNGSLLILLSMAVIFLSVINDILYSNQIITTIYAAPLGFLVFILSQSLILSRRYALSFKTIENLTWNLKNFNKSLSRFVPFQFLDFLDKGSILEVELGNHALREMTILFADIRSFTTLSEVMTPEENFKFLNSFLSQVVPVIREGGGFVDKFLGDGIMALFPHSNDNGLKTAINLQRAVQKYNIARHRAGYIDIKLGIGLHSGKLILGTIGETDRMETTVISDTVNVASRMEQLTKIYGTTIIISEAMYKSLKNPGLFTFRNLGSTEVKGKRQPLIIYEVLDALPQDERIKKSESKPQFEEGIKLYESQKFSEAYNLFQQLLSFNPEDEAIKLYLSQCQKALAKVD